MEEENDDYREDFAVNDAGGSHANPHANPHHPNPNSNPNPNPGNSGNEDVEQGEREQHHSTPKPGGIGDVHAGEGATGNGSEELPIPGADPIVQRVGGLLGLVGILSILVLIQAASECQDSDKCKGYLAFAVAASVISMVVCLGATLVNLLVTELSATTQLWLARLIFILWLVGVGVLTFTGPFTTISNAYFAVWMCFLISATKLRNEESSFRAALDRAQHFGEDMPNEAMLLVSSIVVFFAAIPPVTDNLDGHEIYAMVTSTLSIIFVTALVYLGERMGGVHRARFNIFFFVFWVVTAAVTTFGGPFREAGNGWFGSWISVFVCFSMIRQTS